MYETNENATYHLHLLPGRAAYPKVLPMWPTEWAVYSSDNQSKISGWKLITYDSFSLLSPWSSRTSSQPQSVSPTEADALCNEPELRFGKCVIPLAPFMSLSGFQSRLLDRSCSERRSPKERVRVGELEYEERGEVDGIGV